jgi:hypothetical protein
MKSRVLFWSVAILVLGLAAGVYWWLTGPQTIILSDGTRLTLLAVTYGKHHRLARSKVGGRILSGANLDTTNDALCLWIEEKHKPDNSPNYELLAYDAANTDCADPSDETTAYFVGNLQDDEVTGSAFGAFPRRGSKIYFRVAERDDKGQRKFNKGRFTFPNPVTDRTWERWSPESLPITQQDGDLQVTLTRCINQPDMPEVDGKPLPYDPVDNSIAMAFRVEQSGILVTNWQPIHIKMTDATGNLLDNDSSSNTQEEDEQVMTYELGLWPDEPAWKMRVEMSQQSGFAPNEIWTVSNIPLKKGNPNNLDQEDKRGKPVAETTMGESHLKVFPVLKLTPKQARNFPENTMGVAQIIVDPEPEGMHLKATQITDDQNRPVEYEQGQGGGDYRFNLMKLGDAKSINIVMAFHRSRYVEFTVAAPKR